MCQMVNYSECSCHGERVTCILFEFRILPFIKVNWTIGFTFNLFTVALSNGIPFIGFGFLDNAIMIVAVSDKDAEKFASNS